MFTITKDDLFKAWVEVYRNKPRKKRAFSRGIDNVSIEDFKKDATKNLLNIHRQIKGGFFKFKKLKIYSITQKGKKKSRLIQAPTVGDRVVQKVISNHLQEIFSKKFKNIGIIGSVRGVSLKKALRLALEYHQDGYEYILKTDIQNYFPSIDKKILRKIFYKMVKDKELRKFFYFYSKQSNQPGVPQGTPLSPFMANIYLFDLDESLTKNTEIRHFRYIDDLVVFCKSKQDAQEIFKESEFKFNSLGLSVHPLETPGKTFINRFDSGRVDVLGVIYKDGRLLVKPKKYQNFIQETIHPLKFKSCLNLKNTPVKVAVEDLLEDLTYKINGWGGAYSFCDVKENFKQLDLIIKKNFDELLSKLSLTEEEKTIFKNKLPKLIKILN